MKALCVEQTTEGPTLIPVDVAVPTPGPGDLLLRVDASALNYVDLFGAVGHYQYSRPASVPVAGLEMAGTIVSVGSEVHGFAVGDRVMAMASGAFAEFCVVDHRLALRVPERLTIEQAAAIPVAFMTAHDAVVTNGQLRADESVLVQAVTSSVGIATIQIAKFLGARPIIGTSGSDAKMERLRDFGLEVAVNHKAAAVSDAVLAAVGGKGVDLVIDNVGGSALPANITCLAVRGRLVHIGRLGGRFGELDLDELSRKRLSLKGVTFRTRSMEEHAEVVRRAEADLYDAWSDGLLVPVVDRVFPLAEAMTALACLKAQQHLGKIILKP